MHCEIIIATSTYCFFEIKLKKENLKSVFWAPEFGCLSWYTGLANSLNMSLNTYFQSLARLDNFTEQEYHLRLRCETSS